MTDRLADPTLWITSARTTSDGRACRLMTMFAEDGSPLVEALAFPWKREIIVHATESVRQALIVIRRRHSFPLTGKVDIEADGGRRLGIVTRAGRVLDATGRLVGRFSDTRSLRQRSAESLFEGLANAVVGLESVGAGSAGADSFVFSLGGQALASLVRAPFPFARPGEDVRAQTGLGRLLPHRWRSALARRFEPRGWKFARQNMPGDSDPKLVAGAALFTVELSHW